MAGIVLTSKSQRKQRGYLAGPQSSRFRGDWASGVKYRRGDIVIDPVAKAAGLYVLRWCGQAHTSPATFSPGSEFSKESTGGVTQVQWFYLPTNGPVRPFTPAQDPGGNSNGVQYCPGDLTFRPDSAELARAMYSDAGSAPVGGVPAQFDPAKFDDYGPIPPIAPISSRAIIPIEGMPQADNPGLGFWGKRAAYRFPRGPIVATFITPADTGLTITGTAASVETADPLHPLGSLLLHFNSVATKVLPTPIDMSGVVRFPIRVPGVASTRSGITHAYFEVTSDPSGTFNSGVYKQFEFMTPASAGGDRYVPDNVWAFVGASPDDWKQIGAGVTDLTQPTAIRFNLIGSSSQTCEVALVQAVPNGVGGDGRAKCTIWFDDSDSTTWQNALPVMINYGFPGCVMAAGAIEVSSTTSLTVQQHRYLCRVHGWEIALHYYFGNDGVDALAQVQGVMDAWINAGKHSHLSNGLFGSLIYGYHDNTHGTQQNWEVLNKYFVAARKYDQAQQGLTPLPVPDPMLIKSRGFSGADVADNGAGMNAMIDRAIAAKAWVNLVWDPSLTTADMPGFQAVMSHLAARRDVIDVETPSEVLRPWVYPL